MKRISTNMPNFDANYYMRLREWRMNQMQNKLGAQTRIKELRDDPIAAGHSSRYQSKIARLDQFMGNINQARGEMSLIEGNMRSGLDLLHRIREIAVQGGNGVYEKSQLAYLGQEVNQLLNEFATLSNSRSTEGNFLFSGFKTRVEPFRLYRGRVDGADGEVITQVDYVGDIGRNHAQVAEGSLVSYKIPGNYVFWAENQQIYASREATNYQVQEDSLIRIDGVDISLKEGDNVYAVINKINAAGAPVRARLDPVKNSLVLESTYAHQLWPEDIGQGTVLQDLGIINSGSSSPPLNIADTARVFGGSVFDMIIHLRNSLYAGDIRTVGGSGLRGIDDAIESVTTSLAEMGAKDTRLQITEGRLDYEKPEYIRFNAQEVDLDIAEAITELRMLEYTHRAAVATAARILRPTLLDFLR